MLGSGTRALSQRTSTRFTSLSRCLRPRLTSSRSAKPIKDPKTKPNSLKLSRRSRPQRAIGTSGPNRRVRSPSTSRVHPMTRKTRRGQKGPNLKNPIQRFPKRLSLRNSNRVGLPVAAVVAESKSRAASKRKTPPPTNQIKTKMKAKSLSAHGTSTVSSATMGAT